MNNPQRKICFDLEEVVRMYKDILSENHYERLQKGTDRLVMTTGVFDILHEGHLKYLLKAKEYGGILLVGIDSDSIVNKDKGNERPLIPEYERAFLIAGFEVVDLVYIFSDYLEFINKVQPSVLVVSKTPVVHSWKKRKEIKKAKKLVESYSGKWFELEAQSTITTSQIIKKIRNL